MTTLLIPLKKKLKDLLLHEGRKMDKEFGN